MLEDWGVANVVSLIKKGCMVNPGNYGPLRPTTTTATMVGKSLWSFPMGKEMFFSFGKTRIDFG